MPNQPATKARQVRVDDELWAAAGKRAAEMGETRSLVINRALRIYTGALTVIDTPQIADGDWFSIDGGKTFHLAAVNMAASGTISCYSSGRKSSNGWTYRLDVTQAEIALLRPIGSST